MQLQFHLIMANNDASFYEYVRAEVANRIDLLLAFEEVVWFWSFVTYESMHSKKKKPISNHRRELSRERTVRIYREGPAESCLLRQ